MGSCGDRVATAMKFTSQMLKARATRGLKHLSLGNVLAAVLNVLAAVLSRYNAEFRTQVLDYRHAWHLAAQADIRCCSEWLQRVACAGAAKTVDLHNASFGLAIAAPSSHGTQS